MHQYNQLREAWSLFDRTNKSKLFFFNYISLWTPDPSSSISRAVDYKPDNPCKATGIFRLSKVKATKWMANYFIYQKESEVYIQITSAHY